MRFVTNCDHAHLSESMENDATSRAWDYGYASGADTHNAQEQLQETMRHHVFSFLVSLGHDQEL